MKTTRREILPTFPPSEESRRLWMFDDLVFLAEQGWGGQISSPVGVVAPFIIEISDERSHERGDRRVVRRRRCDLIFAMTNPALISCCAVVQYKSLQTEMLRAYRAERRCVDIEGQILRLRSGFRRRDSLVRPHLWLHGLFAFSLLLCGHSSSVPDH